MNSNFTICQMCNSVNTFFPPQPTRLTILFLSLSPPRSLARPWQLAPLTEKKWFTDETDNAFPRNIQIKPLSGHMANQINQYKSTSSLIPPIREVEDEC